MSKKILITGGKGQLGQTLYLNLRGLYKITNTSRTDFLDCMKLDISDTSQVKDVLSRCVPDIIINCASYNNVDKSEDNKRYARNTIVSGLLNLINNSNKDCKIIHISSDYVFNGEKEKYLETDIPNPINYYGKLKLEAENLLHSSNKNYAIIRCSVVFSHFLNNKSNFFGWIYNNLNNNKEIKVVDDQSCNPTPVNLISKVIESIILLNSNGIYNVGVTDNVNRYDFAMKICQKFKFKESLIQKIKTDHLNQLARRPKNTYLITDKASKDLDIDIYSLDYYLNDIKQAIS